MKGSLIDFIDSINPFDRPSADHEFFSEDDTNWSGAYSGSCDGGAAREIIAKQVTVLDVRDRNRDIALGALVLSAILAFSGTIVWALNRKFSVQPEQLVNTQQVENSAQPDYADAAGSLPALNITAAAYD